MIYDQHGVIATLKACDDANTNNDNGDDNGDDRDDGDVGDDGDDGDVGDNLPIETSPQSSSHAEHDGVF
jgi:hypothetical protein